MCGDFLKGQTVPAEGAGRGRASSRGAGPGGREEALPGQCPSRAGRGVAEGPGPGRTWSSRGGRRAGVGAAASTKGAAGTGAAAVPGRGERRRGGQEPRSGAGAAARAVRARPPVRGSGDAWGSLRLFLGLREACLGLNSLRLGFESQLGPGPLSPGRRKEQPPSLPLPLPPPVHLSRKPPGGGEGARGQRAGGARPGRSSPAFVRGERGKRLQGRPAELLAGRGRMAAS